MVRRHILGSLLVLALAIGMSDGNQAAGQTIAPFGFQPFGFYQPYGVRYQSSTPTPPYFSLNPPVYYGARHFRPYGTSPFASPPVTTAPGTFHAMPAGPAQRVSPGPIGNPFICRAGQSIASRRLTTVSAKAEKSPKSQPVGRIQKNPFVSDETSELIRL